MKSRQSSKIIKSDKAIFLNVLECSGNGESDGLYSLLTFFFLFRVKNAKRLQKRQSSKKLLASRHFLEIRKIVKQIAFIFKQKQLILPFLPNKLMKNGHGQSVSRDFLTLKRGEQVAITTLIKLKLRDFLLNKTINFCTEATSKQLKK